MDDLVECEEMTNREPKKSLGKALFVAGFALYHSLFGFGGTDVHTLKELKAISGHEYYMKSSYMAQAGKALLVE